jgi:hypothetical protein
MKPVEDVESADGFLRTLTVWLTGSLIYLQLLSLLHALSIRPLVAVPWFVIGAWLVFMAWRRGWKGRMGYDTLLTILLLTVPLVLNVVRPPRGYDVLAYHLPFAAHWLNAGWIEPYYSAFSGPIGFYPGNFELLTVSLMGFTGSTFGINGINLISVLLLLAVIMALAARLNLRPALAALLAAGVLFTSKVSRTQFGNGYNDLFFAALVVAALYFAEEYITERRPWDLILSGLLIGAAAGTRYTGLLYIVPLGLYLVWKVRSAKPLALWSLAALLVGGYWYARNAVLAGNPLYPQTLPGLAWPGVTVTRADQFLLAHLYDLRYLRQFFSAILTSGHLLLLPLVILFPLRMFRRTELRVFYITALVAVGLYLVTPLSALSYEHVYLNFRYGLPFVWLGLIAGGLAVLKHWEPVRLTHWLADHPLPVPPLIVGLVLMNAGLWARADYTEHYPQRVKQTNKLYGASWAAVDALPRARLAYTGANLPGPLYGQNLQNNVMYVNVNARNGSNYPSYPAADYRCDADYLAWRHNLETARITYLWTARDDSLAENQWIDRNPETFRLVYQDSSARLFAVEPILTTIQ